MEKMIREERGLCLKVVEGNTTTGIIYAQQESPINGKEGLEKWVVIIEAVSSGHKGKGVGSALLKEMEKRVKQRGASKMFIFTNKGDERVIHFYQKNNYKKAGWIRDYQYSRGNSAAFLLKYL